MLTRENYSFMISIPTSVLLVKAGQRKHLLEILCWPNLSKMVKEICKRGHMSKKSLKTMGLNQKETWDVLI